MSQIQKSKGTAKLEAYYTTCMQAATRNNVQDEISLLRAYQAEASHQNNANHEMQARVLRLYAFFNNNLPDSLKACIHADLNIFEKHKQWDYYYSCRSLLVEQLRYANRLQSALRESEAMYEDAKRQDTNYGKGIAAYLIASCYQNLDRNKEAIDFFEQAEAYLVKEENAGQLHNLYGIAWESYAATAQWDELLKLTDRWEVMWKTYCRKKELQLTDIAPYYVVCLLARAHAYIDRNELPTARHTLDKASAFAQRQRDMARMLLIKEEARYEEAAGNYERALSHLDECLRMQTEHNNQASVLATQEHRAAVLQRLGRYETSSRLYADLLPRKDSLNHLDIAAQMDDLAAIYKVDTLTLQNQITRHQLLFAIIVGVLLLLTVVLYVLYTMKLRCKNRELAKQIRDREHAEQQVEKISLAASPESLSNDELLFNRIQKLMEDKEVLAIPGLRREDIAAMLDTNRTYVVDAIRAGTSGLKVSDYINRKRLKYARLLLEENTNASLEEIAEMCGFSSRSRFSSAFKEYYNMTPREFRSATKSN